MEDLPGSQGKSSGNLRREEFLLILVPQCNPKDGRSVFLHIPTPASRISRALVVSAGDLRDKGLFAGLGRSPGEGNPEGQPLSRILAWRISWTEEPGGL